MITGTEKKLNDLRDALKLDEIPPLILPDPGDDAMVVMRYKGVELAYIIRADHFGHDECVAAPLLKMRDCFQELLTET
jgi:hypothetical protein